MISSEDQIANGFMKALPVRKFIEFKYNINFGSCD
jgi:hypothetical protein